MKHLIKMAPGYRGRIDLIYSCHVSEQELKTMKSSSMPFSFSIPLRGLTLYRRGAENSVFGEESFNIHGGLKPGVGFYLQEHTEFTEILPDYIRPGYIFLMSIAHNMRCAHILNMPVAPFSGFTQAFETDVQIPREVADFQFFRRSIISR